MTPLAQCSNDVLPAPLGPNNAVIFPAGNAKLILSNTVIPSRLSDTASKSIRVC